MVWPIGWVRISSISTMDALSRSAVTYESSFLETLTPRNMSRYLLALTSHIMRFGGFTALKIVKRLISTLFTITYKISGTTGTWRVQRG